MCANKQLHGEFHKIFIHVLFMYTHHIYIIIICFVIFFPVEIQEWEGGVCESSCTMGYSGKGGRDDEHEDAHCCKFKLKK